MPPVSGWPGQLLLFSLISSFRKLPLALLSLSLWSHASFPFSLTELWAGAEINTHIQSAVLHWKTWHSTFLSSVVRFSVSF